MIRKNIKLDSVSPGPASIAAPWIASLSMREKPLKWSMREAIRFPTGGHLFS